jgi:hypothetical protein
MHVQMVAPRVSKGNSATTASQWYAPTSLAIVTARNSTPVIDSMIVNDRAWREMAIMARRARPYL